MLILFLNILSYRKYLQVKGVLDLTLCLLKEPDGTVLLPILPSCLSQLDLQSLKTVVPSDGACELVWSQVNKYEFYSSIMSNRQYYTAALKYFCCLHCFHNRLP